jgi:hypothetical protein
MEREGGTARRTMSRSVAVADCFAKTRAEEWAAAATAAVVLCDFAITTLALQTDSTTRESLSRTKSDVSPHNHARTP